VVLNVEDLQKYYEALRRIAEHFEFCDVSDDPSAALVLRVACKALGWSIEHDEYGQVKLVKGAYEEGVRLRRALPGDL
jgi:hypothetical protein